MGCVLCNINDVWFCSVAFVSVGGSRHIFSGIGIIEIKWSKETRAVVYDFRTKEVTNRFWTYLKRIIEAKGGEMLQDSVYYGHFKGALAVCELVECYGGDVSRFVRAR